jgi:hypothetical protein
MANQPLLHYKSLDDIRARKASLRKELQRDNQSMKTQWNTLFHPEKSDMPSHRIANIMTTSATVFDGLIFAWKLYNRFGGGRTTRKITKKRKGGLLASLFKR